MVLHSLQLTGLRPAHLLQLPAAARSQPKCALGAEAVQHSHGRCKMGEKLVVSVSFSRVGSIFLSASLSKKILMVLLQYIQLCYETKRAALNRTIL